MNFQIYVFGSHHQKFRKKKKEIVLFLIFGLRKSNFLYKLPRFSDGKYHMTPDGELHVLNVNPQDGHSRFQCRTLHTLTGSTQLSVTPARIIVTG